MSSILDALKKVEAERAAQGVRERSRVSPAPGPDPADTRDIMASRRRRRVSTGLPSWILVLGGVVGLVVIMTASVVVALKITGAASGERHASLAPPVADSTPANPAATRPPEAPPTVTPEPQAAPATPPAVEPEPVAASPAPSQPAPAADTAPAPVPEPAQPSAPPAAVQPAAAVAPTPAPQPQPVAPAQQPMVVTVQVMPQQFTQPAATATVVPQVTVSQPAPAAPAPQVAPAPTRVARNEPAIPPLDTSFRSASSAAPAPPRAEKKEPRIPADIRELPPLTTSAKRRCGMEAIKINMLQEANADHPYPYSIINMERVYVGERIPGTDAKLIAVRNRGMAVEITGTQERYYVKF